MIVTDFIFDGTALSSLGYMIVSFDGNNGNREQANATRTFNQISMFNGKYQPFTSYTYADHLEFQLDIFKLDCDGGDFIMSVEEARYMMRWLTRPDAKKLKIVGSEYQDVYYEGSFNVTDIFNGDDRIGLRLTFTTTRPFGVHEAITYEKVFESADDELVITDISDEAGFIYPFVQIECLEDGNVCLQNSYDNRSTIIDGCSTGERIIVTENLILGTDYPSHKVQNDFNYEFLRISNNYNRRTNRITSLTKCKVIISYCPIVKVVF